MKESAPNRLVQTPKCLYDRLDDVLSAADPLSEAEPGRWRTRMRKVVSLAYSRGYQDGYRDGHTDAENGHDERVRASTT